MHNNYENDDYEDEEEKCSFEAGDSEEEQNDGFDDLDDLDDLDDTKNDDQEDGQDDSKIEQSLLDEKSKGKAKLGDIELSDAEWEEIIKIIQDPTVEKEEKIKAKNLAYEALKNIPMIVAKQKYSTYVEHGNNNRLEYLENFRQEGYIGIMEALPDYDPSKGTKISTWVYKYVWHKLRDWIEHNVHNTTPHYYQNARKIIAYIEKMKAEGRECTETDVSIALNLPVTTVRASLKIMERSKNQISTEATIGENKTKVISELADSHMTPEERVIKNVEHNTLLQMMRDTLTKEEFEVIVESYGFRDEVGKTLKSVSKVTGIKEQDIRKLKNSAILKLKQKMAYNKNFSVEKKDRASITPNERIGGILQSPDKIGEDLSSFNFEMAEDMGFDDTSLKELMDMEFPDGIE